MVALLRGGTWLGRRRWHDMRKIFCSLRQFGVRYTAGTWFWNLRERMLSPEKLREAGLL